MVWAWAWIVISLFITLHIFWHLPKQFPGAERGDKTRHFAVIAKQIGNEKNFFQHFLEVCLHVSLKKSDIFSIFPYNSAISILILDNLDTYWCSWNKIQFLPSENLLSVAGILVTIEIISSTIISKTIYQAEHKRLHAQSEFYELRGYFRMVSFTIVSGEDISHKRIIHI